METNQGYGKKLFQCIDVLYLGVENTELLRIAGEGEEDVIRNSNGDPIIPGTSIAGAVQDYLKERKDKEYRTFWGNEKFDNKVYFFDATLMDRYGLEKRTRHKHDDIHGGTEKNKLFQEYYLESGCKFQMVIKVFSFQDENTMVEKFFEDVINGFVNGEILLGSNKNNGCGQINVYEVKRAHFDFRNAGDYVRYYKFRQDDCKDGAYQEFQYNKEELVGKKISMKLNALIRDALLVQAEQIGKQDTEYQVIEPMQSGGKFVIPGSTVKGILRGYCKKICNTLELNEKETYIEQLFGTETESKEEDEKKEKVDKKERKKGSIRIKDVFFEEGSVEQLEYTRIKIDRFTGGTIHGAKMASNPITKGDLTIEIELNPEIGTAEIDKKNFRIGFILLYFSLRDLAQGKISIGSFASVGFGRLKNASLDIKIPAMYMEDTRNSELDNQDSRNLEQHISFGGTTDYGTDIRRFLEKCLEELKDCQKGVQKNGD